LLCCSLQGLNLPLQLWPTDFDMGTVTSMDMIQNLALGFGVVFQFIDSIAFLTVPSRSDEHLPDASSGRWSAR